MADFTGVNVDPAGLSKGQEGAEAQQVDCGNKGKHGCPRACGLDEISREIHQEDPCTGTHTPLIVHYHKALNKALSIFHVTVQFFRRENVTVHYTSLTGPQTVILCSLYYSSDTHRHYAPLMKYAWHIGASVTDSRHTSSKFEFKEADELFHFIDWCNLATAGERFITSILFPTSLPETHLRKHHMYS